MGEEADLRREGADELIAGETQLTHSPSGGVTQNLVPPTVMHGGVGGEREMRERKREREREK
jgi:hypothetical protein